MNLIRLTLIINLLLAMSCGRGTNTQYIEIPVDTPSEATYNLYTLRVDSKAIRGRHIDVYQLELNIQYIYIQLDLGTTPRVISTVGKSILLVELDNGNTIEYKELGHKATIKIRGN